MTGFRKSRPAKTARVLTGLGADVILRIYSGGAHVVNEEEVAEARALLQKLTL